MSVARTLSIAELATTVFDGPFGSNLKSNDYTPSGVRVVRLENIGHRRFIAEKRSFISDEKAAGLARNRLLPGDVLFSSFVEDAVRVCLFPAGLPTPAINKADCFCIRVNPSLALPEFVALRLASPETFKVLRDLVHGATRPRVGLQALKSYRIEVPPLAEQRRIVARIEALFARTRRARADLDRIAPLSRRHRDRILVSAFDSGVPNPITNLALAVFDGPFGSNLKSDDYTKAGTRVVRLENIGHLRFVGDKETFISDEKAQGLRRHHLQPNDVLFSSFIDKEVRVCLFPEGQPARAINKADCFCVRVDLDRADPRYLALRLASPTTYEDMRDAVHGATRPRIGITDLKRYAIKVPSIADQRATAKRVEQQHAMASLIENEAARVLTLLDRLEQSILARAFRGELVPHDPAEGIAASADDPGPPAPRRRVRALA